MKITDEQRALHESAHAAVSEALGVSVHYVTLDAGSRSLAVCVSDMPASECAKALIAAAGMAADAIAGNNHGREAYDDDHAAILESLSHLDRPDVESFIQGAGEIVKKFWPAIERIARALVANRHLNGDTIRHIMRTSPTAPSRTVIVVESDPAQAKAIRRGNVTHSHPTDGLVEGHDRWEWEAPAPAEATTPAEKRVVILVER